MTEGRDRVNGLATRVGDGRNGGWLVRRMDGWMGGEVGDREEERKRSGGGGGV